MDLQIAQLTLQFLSRVNLQANEVDAYLAVRNALESAIREEQDKEVGLPAEI